MKVLCLIGPSGAGKSELIKQLPRSVARMREDYTGYDDKLYISNKLHFSKLRYLGGWFSNVIIKMQNLSARRAELFLVSDRCPYDVCSFVEDRQKLMESVQMYIEELKYSFGIELRTAYVRVEEEVMLRRIKTRLIEQSWRLKYHEDEDEYMRYTRDFFEKNIDKWNYIVENNDGSSAIDILKNIIELEKKPPDGG